MMPLLPRESAKLISRLAQDVKICSLGIENASKMIEEGFTKECYSIAKWKEHELHPKSMDVVAVDWIFLIDTLNFSFWSNRDSQYQVEYKGNLYTGYWSLCAAINRAIDEGYPILSGEFLSTVSLETVKNIFRSKNGIEIPLIEERWKIMNDTGKCLLKKFSGSFSTALTSCSNSAQKLLRLIVEHFPSFRDEATLEGHEISFYKRAQILVADIWACFEGKGLGYFTDINSITMFADYRVPQVLLYLGVLEYSQDLQNTLKQGKLLENGCRLEVEIRGCAIWAVELICQTLEQRQKLNGLEMTMNPILADYYLWDFRRNHVKEIDQVPFHKVRCIYY